MLRHHRRLACSRNRRDNAPPRIEELCELDAQDAAELWRTCKLVVPYNDPIDDFTRAVNGPSSTLLGIRVEHEGGRPGLVGTVMVGHEGHRGWMYYVAVHPDMQGQGLGSALVRAAEAWLAERGVPKAMLLVRETNDKAQGFYRSLDYETSTVTVMQRRL